MNHASCDVSVVIPVYRSRETLNPLIDRLVAALEGTSLSYEIICVDDGSPDDSWLELSRIQRTYPNQVVAVQLMRNFGQHNALMCGFRHACGRYLVTMDDDLQHPPEELPRLVAAIESTNHDLVYGVPLDRQHQSWRNLGSAVVTAFYRHVFRMRVTPSAFRIVRRELIEAILSYDLNYTYVDGLLAWNTRRIGQLPVRHEARKVGRSGYSVGKLLVLALNLFTNFSLLPLQVVSLCGFLAAAAGFAIGGYYLVEYFLNRIVVPGYASIIVAIFLLGGLQLLALGIMGEYLGRLHLNVNRKPQYTIRSIRSASQEAAETRGAEIDVAGESSSTVTESTRGGAA
jgi:polyisoprenyl-phosphate glycosyltransferase